MRMIAMAAAVLALIATAAEAPARDNLAATFTLQATFGPPLAPNCGAAAAQAGSRTLWIGAISGTRIDQFWDRRYPHYAEGCFLSERACRAWLHENLSFMNGGSLGWMRCSPAVPGRVRH